MPQDKLVIIVDDERPEPIVPALQSALGTDAVAVWPLSHLISDFGITFKNGEARAKPIACTFSHLDLEYVIDRVVEITPATVANLDESGISTIGMVSDAYQSILRRHVAISNPAALYATVGRVVPLFSQWALIKRALKEIETPTYAYGYGPEIVANDVVPNAIHKSPFDLYSWKQNSPSPDLMYDRFVVSRPAGRPMLSYIVGNHVAALPLDRSTDSCHPNILEFTPLIAEQFGTRIGEILWFDDNGKITFAAFSHSLFASAKTQHFLDCSHTILSELIIMSSNWKLGASDLEAKY